MRPTRTSIHQSSTRALTRVCYLELGPQQADEIKLWCEYNKRKNDFLLFLS